MNLMSRINNPQVKMSTQIDRESLRQAYFQVRDDKDQISWAIFKYEDNEISLSSTGDSFEEFKSSFADDDRAFAYLRLQTGDEMSRRVKFMMVTWVGREVSPLKRAKMSTDKALVKEILSNFAVELTVETSAELNEEFFKRELVKAGGANYGTGIRSDV